MKNSLSKKNIYLKNISEYLVLWAVGGCIYYGIEVLFRGFSHISMFMLGGLCMQFFTWQGRLTEAFLEKIHADDGILVNGRYRITNAASRCGKLPVGQNVTGWVPASYCGVDTSTGGGGGTKATMEVK